MTKHSGFERARRAAEAERTGEIERAWLGSLPVEVAREFEARVRAAKERGHLPQQLNQPPGTAPNPPRPGHEPRPPKDPSRRRGR